MINLINYALLTEQKKYGYFNKINETFAQTDANLKLVLSGELDDAYMLQWNQLIKSIKAHQQKDGTYIVMIKDNDNADMVALSYTITGNKINIEKDVVVAAQVDVDNFNKTRGTKKTNPTATPGPVTQAIKDAAQKIWVALEGSALTENEGAVYAVFRDNIKTDADLQSLLSYWKSLKLPSFAVSGSIKMDRTSLEKTAEYHKNNKEETDPTGGRYSLEAWLNKFFDSNEIEQVNDKLSVNKITYRFKAL